MDHIMHRVYNFSAGPATLPLEVLQQAKDELLDWQGTGMSVMEISHRSQLFEEIAAQAEIDFRHLLQIPNNYKVLFLQSSGRGQFSMVPMNLLRGMHTADYINTGLWSKMAITEATKYCQVKIVASAETQEYQTIPPESSWQLSSEAAYFHYVDNETINGVEFNSIPQVAANIPLVSDMSSNILSRPLDVARFGLIYAGAQKNIGPAGLTLVIIREDLLGHALPYTPTVWDYKIHADNNSLYYTPPTFAWYLAGLVFKWLQQQGGVEAITQINQRKANKLYTYIDQSGFYYNPIDPLYRSRMNVVFYLHKEALNAEFLKQSQAAGLTNLKGHKLVGGMRASIYNAMPEAGVDALINFMQDFVRSYG
jgi:phosphoserine aminotransferase